MRMLPLCMDSQRLQNCSIKFSVIIKSQYEKQKNQSLNFACISADMIVFNLGF